MNFESFNFHPSIMDGIRALGYTEPTPIQSQSMQSILQGHDLIGLAQTGTGKTAAFVLPILQRLIEGPRKRVRALIISPTRELTEQTCDASNALGRYTGLTSTAIYGGVSMYQQVSRLRNGVEIVAACPGRLLDHLYKGTIDLSHLDVLVLDEADRMFDMGFLPDIRNILRCILNHRQTLLFSATMPKDVRHLVKEILHEPVTVQIGHIAPADTVSHALYPVKQHLKTALLKQLLRGIETESVLIFTRTKHRAKRVAQQLYKTGYNVTSLQGNLSQSQRQAALDGFREGSFKILVATDIAARGIDVLSISHVINYDMPETTDDYSHRIGRTGRVNQNGDAYSFVTTKDAGIVRSLEKVFKSPLEHRTLEGFNYAMPEPEGNPGRPPRKSRPHTIQNIGKRIKDDFRKN
ncbi:DEAD/DEAH box helicase [Chloroflexota bacterium]